jgi:penicillin-binding protein 1A
MTELKPIRSDEAHAEALAEIARLMDAQPGSPEAERLELLGVLVADYERRGFEDAPAPADVLVAAMQAQGRSQAELSAVLGSRARASEVIARRRGVSAEMAQRISGAWGLPARLLGATDGGRPRGAGKATLAGLALAGLFAFGAAGLVVDALRGLPDASAVERLAGQGEVAVERLPPHVYQAFLSAQDARFFRHDGVDAAALARAASANLADPGGRMHGGSSLTQQVVKMTLLKGEKRGLRRKIREAILARRVESRLTKPQIFDLWLNHAYFGGGATGLEAAARRWFGKSANELSVAEAAYLAVVPNAPERLRLDRPGALADAQVRRDRVLIHMTREGFLTPAVADRARLQPLARTVS